MNKRAILILLIISTILSVVIILLNYFGISRLILLHLYKPSSYIEKYSKLPKASDKRKTKIVMKTTQDKISKIKPVLNSILDQTCKVDNIILLVPKNVKIPGYIKKIANIEDSNIKNTLLKQKDKNTNVIQLNDDIVYGKDFLEQMIKKSQKSKKNLCGKYSKLYKIDQIETIDDDESYNKDLEDFKYMENYKRF